jgi:antitoxin MazE
MKTKITRIGNSKGIRIPAKVLEECGITEHVDLVVKGKSIIITPIKSPRSGWDNAAAKLAQKKQDHLIIPDDISTEGGH